MHWLVYLAIVGLIAGVFSSGGERKENTSQDYSLPYEISENLAPGAQPASVNVSYPVYRNNVFEDSYAEEYEAREEVRYQAEDLRSRTEDLNWEINRLKRNADSYDADEFSSKLKRLQYEAENLSSEADDIDADDASSALDDTSWQLQRVRRDIEDDRSYFYREREDEIDYGLRKSGWSSEEASSNFDDFSLGLDDY